ncbi:MULTISPECIES: hypothetical protein [Acinetobacter]|jgi:hypothetical protein|uniref:hypothetical protein n=1 Tax=Acinetobacter TaxID=469 RepID=UPI000277D545|nr:MULTISPECIES: hypothetical protein [Acinetobacter]EJO37410.1 hypothetical protein ACINWCA157_1791 [Acinetobacter radioresistens WC-A-157]MCK4100788.1 hypothetical protein [Acinetobacter radioresistens]RJL69993.1 hypothetical protein D5055_11925 [Acinetobacter radioresistens]
MTTKSEICHTAKEQVAFELMKYIAEVEAAEDQEKYHKPTVREYYLRLYGKCLHVIEFPDSDFRKLMDDRE